MANTSMLKAKGLHTFSNYLSSVPEGALLEAENVVIDRDGIIEPRRGIKHYGQAGTNPASPIEQLFVYKDRILAYAQGKLFFDDSSGNFTAFSSDGTNPYTFNSPGDYRIKGVEKNGNFYFTTDDGIKKISVANASDLNDTPPDITQVTFAGGVRASDIEVSLDLNTPNGFLLPSNTVGYRVVWGTKDANENLILGFPSYNAQLLNGSSTAYGVIVTAQAPQQLVGRTDYFYQLYRSNITSAATASDELRLVYEAPYDGVATSIDIYDNTPEDIRDNGAPLYTNEYSGEGITQANSAPPLCQDISLFKNTVFFANTRSAQTLNLTLQGLDGFIVFDGLATTTNNITSLVYSAIPDETTITLAGAGHGLTAAQDIVIFESNSNSPVILAATFPTANTIVVPGDYSAYLPAETVIFGSYIDAYYDFPIVSERFYFVGRATKTDLFVGSNKASMDQQSSFYLHSADNKIKYVFWCKVNSSTTYTGPVPSGYVLSTIDLTDPGISSSTQVATAIADALNATGSFYATTSTDTVNIVTSDSGAVTGSSATFATLPAVGWTISQVLDGVGEDVINRFIKLSSFVSVGQAIESTAKSMTKVIDRNIPDFNLYYTSSVADLPGKMFAEAVALSTPQFKFTANLKVLPSLENSTGMMFFPNMDTNVNDTAVLSSVEERKNRVYYSKIDQPEAVPLLNYIDIGPRDKAILRIVALRDSLFVLKEEGIYRLTGTSSADFYVALFDSSANIVAPDTASVLNNQIYMLSSQGVATITETGVGIISRPIENIFTRVTTSEFQYYSTASFGCSYESDRAYLLFTVDNITDQYATRAYRYNTFTQAWTMWKVEAASAIVNPATAINKIYLGGSNDNYVSVERKALSKKDYADLEYPIQYAENGYNGTSIQVSSVSNLTEGDIILQTQYLTASQFNRLLIKLDSDGGLGFTQFFNTYQIKPTDGLGRRLNNLTIQLNGIDPIFTISSGSETFSTMQTEFNTLIGQLNNPLAPTVFKDFQTSTGTVEQEILISGFSFYGNTITTDHVTPIIFGPATIYKGIKSKVVWAPISFSDPSILKHVRESTFMFEKSTLSNAIVGFATDLSPAFEEYGFEMENDGSWGNNVYSEFTWGGDGTGVPLRTYVPRQKQRCRFIKSLFKHQAAFYKFSILGISYVFEMTSERGYR